MIDARDPAPWEPAMPEGVRAVIALARRGEGVAAQWLARTGPDPLLVVSPGWGRVGDCFRMLNRGDVSDEIVGWLAGITMFDDDQRLASVLERRSHRDGAIPHVIDAFVAGIRAGIAPSGRLWSSMEKLAARSGMRERLAAVVPIGCASTSALARGAALRLAQRIGEPARLAIEAARAAATGHDAKLLDEALAALAGGGAPANESDVDLLVRLLDAWRATHDPQLEGPIARLGATIGRARGELAARSKGELEGAWLALAAGKDPADVSRLLDAPWPSSWKLALARVAALAELAADPRISLRVAEHARVFDTDSSQPFHAAAARLLARAPTAALVPQLDAIAGARSVSMTASAYAPVHRAIADLRPAPADPQLVAEAASRDDATIELLYAEHFANPGDLAARAVLADALQLAGDPRGEFIALQLAIAAGTADAKARSRADALLALHGEAWTGPLPGVRRTMRRFERGFLVYARTWADATLLARSAERLEWRTVEELHIRQGGVELAPLVRRMPLLRVLSATELSLARLAADGPTPGVRTLWGSWLPPPNTFPDVEIVGGTWFATWSLEAFRAIERQAAMSGLRAIVHASFPTRHLAVALGACDGGPPETRFTFDSTDHGIESRGWRLRVRRGDPIVDLAWHDPDLPYFAPDGEFVYAAIAASGRTQIRLHGPLPQRHSFDLLEGAPIELTA